MIGSRINGKSHGLGCRLLVIDDDDTFREPLCELLRSDGFEVISATHATAAVKQLQSRQFDVVLSDLMMPGNGHLVVEYVHSHQPDTPVIVISSHESLRQVLASCDCGSIACLTKPVRFAQVLQALDQAMQGRARRDQ